LRRLELTVCLFHARNAKGQGRKGGSLLVFEWLTRQYGLFIYRGDGKTFWRRLELTVCLFQARNAKEQGARVGHSLFLSGSPGNTGCLFTGETGRRLVQAGINSLFVSRKERKGARAQRAVTNLMVFPFYRLPFFPVKTKNVPTGRSKTL
jgi:hypothetical protein